MANKYIKQVSGRLTEQEATVTSAGAGDAGEIVALDGTGKLDNSVMPTGIGADTSSIVASEALAAGDFVNIWNDTGTAKVRKADASTSGKAADGFVIAAVANAASATVYFEGSNGQVTGQTPGSVYLSPTTPGLATTTVPTAAGQVVQRLGVATSASNINFERSPEIVLA